MVCIYCGYQTQVVNSRLQKKSNKVWRRRQCLSCQAIFSSIEQNIYENTLVVKNRMSHIVPFYRDQLFLSIFDSCKHRKNAVADASALTETVISKLLSSQESPATIKREDIVKLSGETLKLFDQIAYVHYQAFHPL